MQTKGAPLIGLGGTRFWQADGGWQLDAGVQVRTGKFRAGDLEGRAEPDLVVDSVADLA